MTTFLLTQYLNMSRTLKELDNLFTDQILEVKELARVLTFSEVCEFSIETGNRIIPWEDLKKAGIYLIQIKNDKKHETFADWLSEFDEKWMHSDFAGQFTPSIKKKRIARHSKLNDWVPLYIGKSKDVKSRINGHLNLELLKRTFAMKLIARKNLKQDIFRLSTIELEIENYNAIAPIIESEQRELINPIIGKQ